MAEAHLGNHNARQKVTTDTRNTSEEHSPNRSTSKRPRKVYDASEFEIALQKPSFRALFGTYFDLVSQDGHRMMASCKSCAKMICGDINHSWCFSGHLKVCIPHGDKLLIFIKFHRCFFISKFFFIRKFFHFEIFFISKFFHFNIFFTPNFFYFHNFFHSKFFHSNFFLKKHFSSKNRRVILKSTNSTEPISLNTEVPITWRRRLLQLNFIHEHPHNASYSKHISVFCHKSTIK